MNLNKYFTIVLDDYNQNNINTRPITNVVTSNAIPLPEYFNSSQPYICTPAVPPLSINALGNLTSITEVEIIRKIGIKTIEQNKCMKFMENKCAQFQNVKIRVKMVESY